MWCLWFNKSSLWTDYEYCWNEWLKRVQSIPLTKKNRKNPLNHDLLLVKQKHTQSNIDVVWHEWLQKSQVKQNSVFVKIMCVDWKWCLSRNCLVFGHLIELLLLVFCYNKSANVFKFWLLLLYIQINYTHICACFRGRDGTNLLLLLLLKMD